MPAHETPTIPGYAVQRLLGSGEHCAVWLAHDLAGDPVAIKLLRAGADSTALAASLRHERRVLGLLDHPHIARLHGGGDDAGGRPYLVLEQVDGTDLRTWLATSRPLAARLALLRQIAHALDHVHRQQFMHRDLTPANILVDRHGAARLIDFDKARALADPAGDVHALGKIMVALLDQGAKPELAAIAARASAGRPQDRYTDVAQLLADLDHFAARRPVRAYSNGQCYRMAKWLSRNRAWLGTALVLALMLALAIAALPATLQMVSPTGLEPVTR